VAVYLADERGQMDLVRFEGSPFRPTPRIKLPVGGIAGSVLASGELLNVSDAQAHPEVRPEAGLTTGPEAGLTTGPEEGTRACARAPPARARPAPGGVSSGRWTTAV